MDNFIDATVAVAKEKNSKPKQESGAGTIIILSALYGINDDHVEVKDYVIVGRKVTNKMLGQDPVPRESKLLHIVATVNGKEMEKTSCFFHSFAGI